MEPTFAQCLFMSGFVPVALWIFVGVMKGDFR